MTSVNERMLDATIGHAVDLQYYANGAVRRMMRLLNAVDADLVAQVIAALDRMDADQFSVERLETLLAEVRRLNLAAYETLQVELTDELRKLVEYEVGYQQKLFETTVPQPVQASVTVVAVSAESVYAAALAQPFQGKLLAPFARSVIAELGEARMMRVRDAIRMAYVENESVGQTVRRIRGTKAARYADGLLEIDRRRAEAVVRTAVQHVAGFARDRFYAANDDLVKQVQWVSKLDDRTSEMCRIRDNLKYENTPAHKPVGHSVPWLSGPGRIHWNCRSTSAPVLPSWQELGIDAQEAPPGTRASMDGQVPEDMNYHDWLKRQSAKRQDDILGPTRGALMRDGKLEPDRFYNERGKWLTLDELRRRDAAAFRRAGL